MQPFRIVLDIDGVIADCEAAAMARFGPCDRSLYSFYKRWPGQESEIKAWLDDPATYANLAPINGAWSGLHTLRAAGHEIILATARPHSLTMRTLTLEWLARELKFIPDDVYVCGFADKPNLINSLRPHYVIEDSSEQVLALRAYGVFTIAFDQPWNQDLPAEVRRAADWDDLLGQLGLY